MKYIFLLISFAAISFSCGENKSDNATNVIEPAQDRKTDLESEVAELAKPAYIEAFTQVHTLKNNISLVDSGLVEKSAVVREYNSTVGLYMGRLSDFESIRARMDTAGDAYIEFRYQKEKARIAFEKAAELEFEQNNK